MMSLEMSLTETKVCTGCKEVLPKTDENFQKYLLKRNGRYYYHPKCRPCISIKMSKLYREVARYQCGCGSTVSKRTVKVHNSSKKHLRYLNN